eukprot:scaffold6852_cov215-Ochromonas_danica.AAC.28
MFLDGKHHARFNLDKTGLAGNFTRAYYSASGRYTITGSCEQSLVKLLCTYTGTVLTSVDMAPMMRDPSIYVQSLRGSPRDDFKMCVLTNYRDIPVRELVYVQAVPPADSDLLPATTSCDVEETECKEAVEVDLLKGARTLPLAMTSHRYLDHMFELRLIADSAVAHVVPSNHGDIKPLSLSDKKHDLVFLRHREDEHSVQGVHGFLLLARVQRLYKLAQEQAAVFSVDHQIDVTSILTLAEWKLISIYIDYLYVGLAAMERSTLRCYACKELPQEEKDKLYGIYFPPMTSLASNFADDSDSENEKDDVSPEEAWRRQEKALIFDESIWRVEPLLIHQEIETVKTCYTLFEKMGAQDCCAHILWLIGTSMLIPANAVLFWKWAIAEQLTPLQMTCVRYIANHPDVISGLSVEPLLKQDVDKVVESNLAEVVTREQFQDRLEQLGHYFQSHPAGENVESFVRQLRKSWRKEEAPYLPVMAPFHRAACLSNCMWHVCCRVMDDSLLFLGGMNRDRLNNFSRVLVYDISLDRFRYAQCTGTELPASAYMHACIPLEKHNTKHIVVLGGKVRSGEVSKKEASKRRNVIWESRTSPLSISTTASSTTKTNQNENNAKKTNNTDSWPQLYQLDYENLTWSKKPVQLLLYQGDHNRSTFSRFAQAYFKEENRHLTNALRSRVAQSVVVIHREDLPYRCSKCLFNPTTGTRVRDARTDCLHEANEENSATWSIQFGGFCPVREHACNDVHVLISKFSSKTGQYSHSWMRVEPGGSLPAERFSHSAVFVPSVSSGARYGRVIIVGGVVPEFVHQVTEGADVLSLRINHLFEGEDVQWEEVHSRGRGPARLHGHSLVHIPDSNVCLLTGGITHGTREVLIDMVWCMKLEERGNLGSTSLHVTWSKPAIDGVAPLPRSRHTACAISWGERKEIFVFGGLDETRDSDGQPDEGLNESKPRDSVMHRLLWAQCNAPLDRPVWQDRSIDSTALWLDNKPDLTIPACTLGPDMRRLVYVEPNKDHIPSLTFPQSVVASNENDPFQPDLLITFQAESVIRVFATLVSHRSPLLGTLLGTEMIEASTGVVRFAEGPSVQAMKELMEYLCSDYLSLTTVQQTADILELANQHGLAELMKVCEGAFLRLVEGSTVCDLLGYADSYNLELLRATCYSHLLRTDKAALTELLEDENEEKTVKENREDMEVEEEERYSRLLSEESLAAFRAFVRNNVHVYQENVSLASAAL